MNGNTIAVTAIVHAVLSYFTPARLVVVASLTYCMPLVRAFTIGVYWGVGSMIGNLVMTISFIYRDGGIDVDRSLIFADIYLGLYSFILGMYGLYGDQNMSTKTKQSRRDLNGELPKTVMDCQSSNTYLSKCFKPFCHFFPAATLPPINMRDFTTLRLIGFISGCWQGAEIPIKLMGVFPAIEFEHMGSFICYFFVFSLCGILGMGFVAGIYGECSKCISALSGTDTVERGFRTASNGLAVFLGVWIFSRGIYTTI